MIARLIVLAILTIGVLSSSAQATTMQYAPRVRVEVYADNLAGKIQGCLTRELRRLPGVTVVENEPEWVIDVIGFKPQNGVGNVLGYALSVVILESFDLEPLDSESFDLEPFGAQKVGFKQISTPQSNPAGEPSMAKLYAYRGHRLAVGSLTNLKKLCKEIAMDFDTRHLKPLRQLFEAPMDGAEE